MDKEVKKEFLDVYTFLSKQSAINDNVSESLHTCNDLIKIQKQIIDLLNDKIKVLEKRIEVLESK